MLKIRLQRIGRRNNPSYRVVVVDSRAAAKKGKPVELLGTHDTIRKTTSLNNERIKYWMSQGAQVSDTMHNILIKNGVIEGVKINVLPKKSPIVKKKEGADGEDATKDVQVADGSADDNADKSNENTATETSSEAKEVKAEDGDGETVAPPETPEKKPEEKENTSNDAEIDEEKPQSPPPQDTPSAEG